MTKVTKPQLFRCMAAECNKQVPLQDFNLETFMCDSCSDTYYLNSFEMCLSEPKK